MSDRSIKKIGVLYTCITGRYDELSDHTYIDPRWEYVCFTDAPPLKDNKYISWRILPLVFDELDHARNQRWHKLHPHILFPEYQNSVWLDANINILNKDIFEDIDRAIYKKCKMALPPHFVRNCIYDEWLACIEIGKDNKELMEKQIQLIKETGFPEKHGLFESYIIYRDHHDKQIISVMGDWWWFIKNYSRRDQLSLTYVLWKQNINADQLTDISYRKKDGIEFIIRESHITKEELICQRNKLQAIIREKDQELSNLINSRSWRITRPLRQIRSFYKAVSSLLNKMKNEGGKKSIRKYLRIGNQGNSFNEKRERIIQQFTEKAGYSPDIETPHTFNEKIQWLKLYYRDALMTQCADKYKARDYVKKIIGEQYLIKLLGVYDDVNQIIFDKLPDKFILKVNHGSGQNIICEHKNNLDVEDAKNKLSEWIKTSSNHYYYSYEWSYKDIKPAIVCEELIENPTDLKEYKFFCFNGQVKILYVASERNTGLKIDYFDLNWHKMPIICYYPNSLKELRKPHNFDLMISLAEKLSKPFPFVRVDLYEVDDAVYFGEMTFYPHNGIMPFSPVEWDYKLGDMLKLPPKGELPGNQ